MNRRAHRSPSDNSDPENVTPPTDIVNQVALAPHEPVPYDNARGVPYRGSEQHGVAYTHGERYRWDENLGDDSFDPAHQHAAPHDETPIYVADPIDVRIVSSPHPITDRTLWAAVATPIIVGAQPVQLVGPRLERSSLKILAKPTAGNATAGRVWLMPRSDFSIAEAIPLDAGDPPIELNTTESVWAVIDSNAAFPSEVFCIVLYQTEAPNVKALADKAVKKRS